MVEALKRCAVCGELVSSGYSHCEACSAGSADESFVEADAEKEVEEWRGKLPLNLRRRYAKAVTMFEVGIWSAKSVDNLFGVMLGSMAGVRNSYGEVRLDNRKLRYELKTMGLGYTDCFSGELSPESHEFIKRDGSRGLTVGELWHGHGFFKMAEVMRASDLHGVLSPLWGKIHGSQVVDVKIIYDEAKAIKYAVKDAVKAYLSDGHRNQRLMMSDGWLPLGFREVNRMLTKWALVHRWDWDNLPSMPDEGYSLRLEFIPLVWEVKRDLLRRWCKGKSVSLDFGDYKVFILGESISKYGIKTKGGVSYE